MDDIFVKVNNEIKSYGTSLNKVYTKTYNPITIKENDDKIINIKSLLIANESDQYFKVKKLFSEIESDYDKAKARLNLGIDLEKTTVKLTWDDELDKLKISDNNNSYISNCFEKLEPPAAPTISTTTYYVATGNVSIIVTNNKIGSKMYYSTNGVDYAETTGSISLASTFTNNSNNSDKIYTVYVKSYYNGEYSKINLYTITIKPKCTAGTISVTRTPNNNNYATKAVITFTPSNMTGVDNYYSTNSGNSWIKFTSIIQIETNVSVNANVYLLKVEHSGYQTTVSKNSAITLNALKTYYGCSEESTISASDITLLTGGNSLENSGIEKNKKYTLTLAQPSYVWICQSTTLSPNAIFHESTDTIPAGFNSAIIINGYNCYRSIEIWKSGSSSIYLKG